MPQNESPKLGSTTNETVDPTVAGNARMRKPPAQYSPYIEPSFLARFWKLLGGLLIFVAFVVIKTGNGDYVRAYLANRFFDGTYIIIAIAILVTYIGLKCFAFWKRHLAATLPALSSIDKRRPILYLRSFKDDSKMARLPLLKLLSLVRMLASLWALGAGDKALDITTEEEQLVRTFNYIGPMVSIGRPTERVPYLGSARVYVDNHEWQNTVTDLIPKAQIVVLMVAETEGFLWELQTSAKLIVPERLIFLIPFGRRRYEKFRRRIEAKFPHPLPPYNGRWKPYSTIRGIIYFESDWTPHFEKLNRRDAKGYEKEHLVPMLQVALLPVFKQLKLPWLLPVTDHDYRI